VAIGGVAVGVAALIMAFSITRGFSSEIEKKIVGFSSYVQVANIDDSAIDSSLEVKDELLQIENVLDVRSIIEEFVLVQSKSQIEGVSIWGLDQKPEFLESYLTDGKLDLVEEVDGRKPVVLSKTIADKIGASVGSTVTMFSTRGQDDGEIGGGAFGAGLRPKIGQFYVGGIYDSGFADFDDLYILANIDDTRSLLGYKAVQVSRFDVSFDNWDQAESSISSIEEGLGFPYWARSVRDIYSHIFAWVELQQGIIPLVISIITIVASFNIIGTLLIAVLEKTSQIGVLSSLGATRRQIRQIFVGLGLGIGVVGVVIGELSALGLLLIQKKYSIIPLPADTYYMTTAPVQFQLFDFVWVGLLAMLLCMLAAYIPARVAANSDPVSSIRLGN